MEEQYLGGFESARLSKGWTRGYGIYATDKRIIGVKSRKSIGKVILGEALGGSIGAYVGMQMSHDESMKQIQELEKRKDVEFMKEGILSLELKKPSFFSGGHILISPVNENAVKIQIGRKDEYEQLLGLMKSFHPTAVRVV